MFYSVRAQIVVTFILLLIVPLVTIAVLINHLSNKAIGESIVVSTSQTMDQYAAFVNTLTRQVEDVANQVLSNELTQQWVAAQLRGGLLESERIVLNTDLRKYLSSVALNNSAIASITIFDFRGNAVGIRDNVFHDHSYMESEWYTSFLSEGQRWANSHLDSYQPNYLQGEYVNSLLFPVLQLSNFKEVGVLKVNFLSSRMEEQLNRIDFGANSHLYLLDTKGNPVIHSSHWEANHDLQEQLEQLWADPRRGGEITYKQNAEEQMLFFRKLNGTDWILIGQIPQKDLFHQLRNLEKTIFLISVIVLLITVVAGYYFSSMIAKPLSLLVGAMRYIERGDFTKAEKALAMQRKLNNEFSYATMVFRNMLNRLRHLIETDYQSNIRRRDAEFKALLIQINPHFLYNTLEVIGSLSIQGRNMDVVDVTESLGLMLRLSLKSDTETVSLTEELRYIRYYISIMEVRFGERMEVVIEEPPQTDRYKIVKFILQPLVENAIKYSIDNKDVAKVRIVITDKGDKLHIVVQDNGQGMPQEVIDEVLQIQDQVYFDNANDALNSAGKQIGLRNVLTRCHLYYGTKFKASIISQTNEGTQIMLEIPMDYEE